MQAEIQQEVERCAEEIRRICPDSRIVVFGSAISDNVTNPRDIDLLIIVPNSLTFKQIRRKILAIPRSSWPLDLIVVPNDFFTEKLHQSGNFYAFIYHEGVELGTKQKISA